MPFRSLFVVLFEKGKMSLFYEGLDPDIKAVLLSQIRNLWTHSSTAIEGNSLTLGDTAFVLDEGLTVSGKPLRDHQEIYGHAKGIELVYRFLDSDTLKEEDIFALHRVVLTEGITDIFQPVGWKNEPNFTNYVGSDGKQHWRQFPDPENIKELMRQWLIRFNAAYRQPQDMESAAQTYADLHLDFVTIHPFFDGNGRVARLLGNLPVLRSGFPPIVVPAEARQEYKKAISAYQDTIQSLDQVKDVESLPNNPERNYFRVLCSLYWKPTMDLLVEARRMQHLKESGRIDVPKENDRKGGWKIG